MQNKNKNHQVNIMQRTSIGKISKDSLIKQNHHKMNYLIESMMIKLEVINDAYRLKIYGLADGQFLINHYWIPSSVIIFPKRFYMWNVVDASEIKPHSLEIMNFIKPRPDYLIIGTGETNVNLDFSFYDHFRRMGITVDTCPSVSEILKVSFL
jgi:NADH dehydrogenase [ubiquinone] 1 alpha subcomplex assembly factor 3